MVVERDDTDEDDEEEDAEEEEDDESDDYEEDVKPKKKARPKLRRAAKTKPQGAEAKDAAPQPLPEKQKKDKEAEPAAEPETPPPKKQHKEATHTAEVALGEIDWKLVKRRVGKIVASSNLEELSARQVREQLAPEFGDLTEHKKKLKKLIDAVVDKVNGAGA